MMTATDPKAEWVARVLGVTIPRAAGLANGVTGGGGNAMSRWQAARSAAVASLKSLEAAFRAMAEPETDPAIILLRAIQANLTPVPASLQQVVELERYVTNDDIIDSAEQPNGFGFKVELKTPLLAALAGLRAELQATQGART